MRGLVCAAGLLYTTIKQIPTERKKAKMQTIELNVEEPLLAAVDQASRALAMTRADFARLAFELALRHQNILAQEQQQADGLLAPGR